MTAKTPTGPRIRSALAIEPHEFTDEWRPTVDAAPEQVCIVLDEADQIALVCGYSWKLQPIGIADCRPAGIPLSALKKTSFTWICYGEYIEKQKERPMIDTLVAQQDCRSIHNDGIFTGVTPDSQGHPNRWGIYANGTRVAIMEEAMPWLEQETIDYLARLMALSPELLTAAQNAANVLAALATGQLKEVTRDSAALAQLRAVLAKVEK